MPAASITPANRRSNLVRFISYEIAHGATIKIVLNLKPRLRCTILHAQAVGKLRDRRTRNYPRLMKIRRPGLKGWEGYRKRRDAGASGGR